MAKGSWLQKEKNVNSVKGQQRQLFFLTVVTEFDAVDYNIQILLNGRIIYDYNKY